MLAILSCALLLAGCRGMTVLSNDKPSPSTNYWASVTKYGAPGKPFQDRTEKNVVIYVAEQLPEPKERRFRPQVPELRQESLQLIDYPRSREVYHQHLKLEAGDLASI
ncbi:MAG TPA: hypothetical protein VLZ12_04395, partial [Verrucomicrobiae bacterium]|nr:hypothetical protein [Verrucomicrobiae bacterium]